jgi:teichuronic acid biosynthesis glycosyltransferase TuaC
VTPDERRVRRRILVLSGIFPNRRNPTWGIHVFQNVRALAGHADVRMVAPVPWVPKILARGRYLAYTGVPHHDEWAGIPVVYPRFFVVPKLGRFLHGFGLFFSILPTMQREVHSFRPDALLAYFAYPYGFAAVRLGSRFHLPVVVSCRGSDVNLMTGPRLQGRLIVRSLRACRRVLVMSQEMRERVLSWGIDPARVEVVSNGVDTSRFAPADRTSAREALGVPAEGHVIVCVSRLSHEKGIDTLVDAVAKIDDALLSVYVVGDGAERAALSERVAKAGIERRFTFAGTRPHDEIPRWLAAADVVALPSRTEGMPNAVLEALASGRPVVASAVGGTRELIDQPSLGRLVPPENPDALAAALQEAIATAWDPAVIARSVASRTWDAVGARTAQSVFEPESTSMAHTHAEHTTWNAGTR